MSGGFGYDWELAHHGHHPHSGASVTDTAWVVASDMTQSLRDSAILLVAVSDFTRVAASDMNESLRATAILVPSPRGFAPGAADIKRRQSDKDQERGSHGHHPPSGE